MVPSLICTSFSRLPPCSVGSPPCQSAPLLAQSAPLLAREQTCLHLILVSQPPFTSHPPPPPRGRGGDEYGLPSCLLNMGRGGQGSPTTPCFTWPLPSSISPPPSVVQGLCGEGDMGQTYFRDKGRRGGTQLLMQSPSSSSYNKSSLRSQSRQQSQSSHRS